MKKLLEEIRCKECGSPYIVNKKYQLCDECNFKRLHDGRSKREVYSQRQKRVLVKPIKPVSKKRTLVCKVDDKIYEEIWREKEHICENCGKELGEEKKSLYFSHILSKGAYPEFRHRKENFNLLCFECHRKWEDGTEESRSKMKVYLYNKKVEEELKKERNEFR